MNIIEKVKKLKFPFGQYVVISGGTLEALGIRDTEDVDIAVLLELHKKIRKGGEWREEVRHNKIFLVKDGIEINPDISWASYQTSTKQVIDTAIVVDGVPFMNLIELKKFKIALGRDKDLRDIKLINKYIEKHNRL